MADNPLQFADFGNALLAGSQAAYYSGRAGHEREAEKRRQEAQPFIEPAVRGDMGAFAKVAAGDPATAASVAASLSRMDAATLAKAKAATDYTTGVTTGLLSAPPADQERLYQMSRAEAQAKGMDISRWPANFDAPWVQMQHGIGVGAKTWFEQNQQNQRHATPAGGAQTLGYMDGKGTAAGGAPQPNRDQFIQTMMPHAMAVAQATGLDPRLVLAQSALETSFGGAAPGNNYFGIKSHGAPGGQVLATNEAGPGGGMVPTNDSFRTYADPGASARDYAEFLKTNSRYQPVLAAKGLDAQIDAMGRSGYATDPNYATKLRQIAQSMPAGLPATGPPTPLIPAQAQAGGPAPGVPGPIAQGDTPQADASGTPLPPAGAQQGQLPIQGDFAMEDPKPYGYRMLARVTNGVPVPLQSADGHYIYEDPQTKRTVLYKPRPVEAPPSGYRSGPNGSLVAIPGGPADKGEANAQAANKAATDQANKLTEQANKLRDDFRSEPVVKAYRVVVPMLESAKDATTRPTRAADLNLVYAFAKLMDPESVVRESETGMVVASGTVADRLAGILGQLNGGQTLQPETRKKLIAELDSRFRSLEESYTELSGAYGEIADANGVKRNHVILPIRKPKEAATADKPASDAISTPASKADYDALPSGTQFKAPDGSIRTKP